VKLCMCGIDLFPCAPLGFLLRFLGEQSSHVDLSLLLEAYSLVRRHETEETSNLYHLISFHGFFFLKYVAAHLHKVLTTLFE
jgi:hypothetical protein